MDSRKNFMSALCLILLALFSISCYYDGGNYGGSRTSSATGTISSSEHSGSKLGISIGFNRLLDILCKQTLYPDACYKELSAFNIPIAASPSQVISFSAQAAASRASDLQSISASLAASSSDVDVEGQCAADCADLMGYAKAHLEASMAKLSSIATVADLQSDLRDVKVWLSEALSYQAACYDALVELVPTSQTGTQLQSIQGAQDYLSQVIGNTMLLVDILNVVGDDLGAWMVGLPPIPPFIHLRRRRLLQLQKHDNEVRQKYVVDELAADDYDEFRGGSETAERDIDHDVFPDWEKAHAEEGFPSWASGAGRRLMQKDPGQFPNWANVNAVVAQDGSGDYENVTAAVMAIPVGSYQGRYVIYIKAGLYEEVFNVTQEMVNVTFVGDGMDRTIITGSRNVSSGLFNTYRTSTVGIAGDGFHARDITFRNTAGATGHQAVAMRAGADLLIFYRCSFEGFQDTLYALSGRQLYKSCRIYGTVDFIFGNAIAIFQDCDLVARLPLPSQTNTITAQGRKLLADVSGFSFINCTLYGDLQLHTGNHSYAVDTYLGRPWKPFSRVVFMNCEMTDVIHPNGWTPWNESNPFIETLYYGEFQNFGPGAFTGSRVMWPGVHPTMTPDEAAQFSFDAFIAGSTWVSPSDINYI